MRPTGFGRRRPPITAIALLAAGLAGPFGCGGSGDGLPRQEVSGTVTLDGEPLAEGMIVLQPKASSAEATQVAAPIERGRYRFPRAVGPVPGDYVVSISATDRGGYVPSGSPEDEDPAAQIRSPGPSLPARYNTASQLTASVTAEGPNSFDFDLTSD